MRRSKLRPGTSLPRGGSRDAPSHRGDREPASGTGFRDVEKVRGRSTPMVLSRYATTDVTPSPRLLSLVAAPRAHAYPAKTGQDASSGSLELGASMTKALMAQGNSRGGPRRARTDDRRIKGAIGTRSAWPRSGKACVVPTGSLTLRPVDCIDCVPQMCHSGSSVLTLQRLTLQFLLSLPKEPSKIERSGEGEQGPLRQPSLTRSWQPAHPDAGPLAGRVARSADEGWQRPRLIGAGGQ